MQLFQITDKLIEENRNNLPALQVLARSLTLLIKIYYDLNCQDLPEFCEDNLPTFMGLFEKYLVYQNPLLVTDDEEEEGPLEQIKTGICYILELYASRYEDAFPQLEHFVPIVVGLLTTTGPESKYDAMVCKALTVLTAIVKIERHSHIFADPVQLGNMCERVALPNVGLRLVDEELFEDNPIEYIRRDLEGSDTDTRRRAAADFIRGLMERFEAQVTKIMSEYVTRYLQTYSANPKDNWKDKNTAIFLLVAIATRSANSTQGVTKTNELVDVVDFFSKHVLCDLQSDVNTEIPILKVDAIKYVYSFRNQLTKEQLLTVFPLLVKHLESTDYVVHTYAAIAIERILFIRQGKAMMFTAADILPYSEALLSQLFRLIELGQTPEKLSENDYLMRCVMRVIITSRQDMMPYVNVIMGKLTNILSIVTLAHFENMCFGPFQTILSQVPEFNPYVFQLLAQLLEQHKGTELTDSYVTLLVPLLNPGLWEQGNIPALVRLLQAYLEKGINTILANNQLEPILGIFQQKLVNSRQFDHYGMLLLHTITLRVPIKKKGDDILFDRFTRTFTLWMSLCFLIEPMGGPDTIIRVYDGLQPGLFGQIMGLFVVPDLSKLVKPLDRKLGGSGMIRLLTKSDLMLVEPYVSQLWTKSLLSLLALLETPVAVESDGPDELYTFDLDAEGYQTTFAKLATSNPVPQDPTAGLPACQIYLAQQIMTMPADKRAIVKNLLLQSPEATQYLPQYFQAANISLDQL
ncbi:Cse1-domain-containing protein [Mucor mucedo]|uniref:Cse1-domain-containing protein n=1 Tax=Mucor mucedo TaxID=29922 RepID=UPI00222126EA|nr:Cse1-domain-containing protein [Mucor mucedo]KAI7887653.1 Cse1-domain-containing protein [Mucor mucedo]